MEIKKETLVIIAIIVVGFFLYKKNKPKQLTIKKPILKNEANKTTEHVCGCDKGQGDPTICKCGGAINNLGSVIDESNKVVVDNVVSFQSSITEIKGEEHVEDFLDDLSKNITYLKSILESGKLSEEQFSAVQLLIKNDYELYLKIEEMLKEYQDDTIRDLDLLNMYLVRQIPNHDLLNEYLNANNIEIINKQYDAYIILLPENEIMMQQLSNSTGIGELILMLSREKQVFKKVG